MLRCLDGGFLLAITRQLQQRQHAASAGIEVKSSEEEQAPE